MSIHWSPALDLLALLLAANGAPVLLALASVRRPAARPIDGGRRWSDGRPALGPAKTWRGLAASLVLTGALAPVLGIDWRLGLSVAAGAMAGDLLASFVKRRLGCASSASVPGLDQLPEGLIPGLLAAGGLGLDLADLAIAIGLFALIDLALTPALRRLRARLKPR